MTRPDPNDPNGSTRIGQDSSATGTHTGADVTSRMTGSDHRTETERPHSPDDVRTTDVRSSDDRHLDRDRSDHDYDRGAVGRDRDRSDHDYDRGAVGRDHDRSRDVDTRTTSSTSREHDDVRLAKAKTSAAATFALVFGLAALFCALTGLLSPVAVVFGLIGIVLAVFGFKMTKRRGVTGRGLAIGGLVTALLGLLIGAAVIAGAAVFVNNESNLDRIQGWVDDARSNLPSGNEVVEQVPGN